MHLKFLRHGQGSTAGAVRYLLQEHDHNGERRAEVTVLRGDPHLVAQVADASPHRWRYTSGVIAWAPEDNPTVAEIEAVLEDWERTAFAGLEPDQYATCAVLHRDDDGTPHIHTLTARIELTTGRALNIAPPSHQKTFDPLRDAWNHAKGWARPDDPDRARPVQPGDEGHRSKPDKHPRTRADITEHIEALAAKGLVTTAAEVREELAEIGEITRASHAFVSVRPHGEKQAIRLKGDLYRDNWTIEQTLEREARRETQRAAGRAGPCDPAAAERARGRLAAAVERRAEYHRGRYQRADAAPERGDSRSVEPGRVSADAATLELGDRPEPVGGAAAGADSGHRTAAVDRGDPGRAAEPDRRPAELDTTGGDHRGVMLAVGSVTAGGLHLADRLIDSRLERLITLRQDIRRAEEAAPRLPEGVEVRTIQGEPYLVGIDRTQPGWGH
ncbi:relaxase/mobilization nuclease domain-containing protein [Halomonas sp. BC04]|uniref:relaxase/mobilization nuclease domain-containing protein n=1 Tax=Halomonas sp. BC04 TaxID=1403540 RepID=UPI0009DE0CFB|nr:relaxase/mobilization nuclease domain-containing protein [Halomonas sp. BC04]